MINSHTQGEISRRQEILAASSKARQALDVPIYLHPREPHPAVMKAYFEGFEDISTAAWGFAMETCTHFLRLVMAGVFDAYPKLDFILGHLGEGLPFWLDRFEDHTRFYMKRRGLKKTPRAVSDREPGHHLQRQFLDAGVLVHGHGDGHRQRAVLGRLAL